MQEHPCPYCDGKGRVKSPAEVQWAVHQLSRPTIEHAMLCALAERFDQWVETPTLMFLLYGGRDSEPYPKVLATMAKRLRGKLKPYGLVVEGTSTSPNAYRLVLIEGVTSGYAMGPRTPPYDGYSEVDAIRLPDARQWLYASPRAP